jgi:hypothetical protein
MTEIWTFKQGHVRRLKTVEMKFMRYTAIYKSLDHRRYEDILDVIKVEKFETKLAQ